MSSRSPCLPDDWSVVEFVAQARIVGGSAPTMPLAGVVVVLRWPGRSPCGVVLPVSGVRRALREAARREPGLDLPTVKWTWMARRGACPPGATDQGSGASLAAKASVQPEPVATVLGSPAESRRNGAAGWPERLTG